MIPKYRNGIQKKWIVDQLKEATTLKTAEKVHQILDILQDEKDVKTRFLTARDATFDQALELFGLKILHEDWEQREETYSTPQSLIDNLEQLEKALYDTSSEAYNRIAVDYLIVACMVKHREIISEQSNHGDQTTDTTSKLKQIKLLASDPHNATVIAPATPLKSTFRPLPLKVFPEISLSVQVETGGQVWTITGIADWAVGYGNRASLEDGTILLAIEAKRIENLFTARAQLLVYLATIRQLRIQANKINVTVQGFLSDRQRYMFICIRNNGDVIESPLYKIHTKRGLKSVFNFLLSILITSAGSSLNTSPIKQPKQDEEINNFDRDIFVKVFKDEEDEDVDNIFCDLEPGEGIPDKDFSKDE